MRKFSFIAILWTGLFVSCNGGFTFTYGSGISSGVSDEDALYELTGRWYNKWNDYAFEITEAGGGYIAGNGTYYTVSVSSRSVFFKDSRGVSIGSLNYSLRNGTLTMNSGSGVFRDMPSASPFIKAGSVPSGGAVPVALIGAWYAKTIQPDTLRFQIAASGAMTIPGSSVSYTAIVSGNTVSVLEGSILKGAFQYSVIYGEMVVTNGTDVCAGLSVLSPFVKH